MKLNEKAMLGNLRITQWTARKTDKQANQETADKHQADASQISTNKYLVAKKSLSKINSLAKSIREEFKTLSLPWTDEGERVVTSAAFFEISKRVRTWKDDYWTAVDEFIGQYPALKAQAQTSAMNGSLGTLYNDEDFPDVDKLRDKFSIDFGVRPLPDSGDFRVKMSEVESTMVKQQIDAENKQATEAAMRDIWSRLQAVLERMADGLKQYHKLDTPIQKNGRTHFAENNFHGTLVTNVKDLLNIVPLLNLTEDQNLEQFAQDMKKLVQYDADQLKENDGVREYITKSAEDILSKMKAYV